MCSYMCTFVNVYLMVVCVCVRLIVHLGLCISLRHIMSIPVRYTSHMTVCIIENSQCQMYLECKANLLISFFACLMRIMPIFNRKTLRRTADLTSLISQLVGLLFPPFSDFSSCDLPILESVSTCSAL